MLAENIQQNEDDMPRVYGLSRDAPNSEASDRMVFTATGDASCLPELMEAMAENDIELVRLHERLKKTMLGSYGYLIKCANIGYEGLEKLAVADGFELRYYGTFSVK